MTRCSPRRGYTLIELLAVMAVLVLIAAVVIPSVAAFRGDSRPRAAADAIRGELAVARARAKEEGRPYRVALSEDGKRLRRAPDEPDFGEVSASGGASGSSPAVDYAFDTVTASVVPEPDSAPPAAVNGWTTLATVLPDGTCREDSVLVSLKDGDGPQLQLRIRGLLGRSRVVAGPGANGGAK